MYKKYLRLFPVLIIALLFFTSTADASNGPSVSARCAVLADAQSGRVLFEKNADEQRLIASTTKIMTGLLAVELADPAAVVTILPEHTKVDGTRLYFQVGDELTVEELLYATLLLSGNDAALALADHCGPGIDAFVSRMNDKAKELGLSNTHFANPHGLDAEGHYSTARDLAKLASAAMENPGFARIVGLKSAQAYGRIIRNHNKMLWRYEGADGLKTGFTKKAGRCLVSSATRNGRQLIAVTLDAPSDWDDHANMFDFGFSAFSQYRLSTGGKVIGKLPVVAGQKRMTQVYMEDTLEVTLTKEEASRLYTTVELPHFLWAPIQANKPVGRVVFALDGHVLGETKLLAFDEVTEDAPPPPFWLRFFSRTEGAFT